MKHKRLNRDGRGFRYSPCYRTRVDTEAFHGIACLIRMTDGEKNRWETPKAGRVQVTGAGMCRPELIPDDRHTVMTVMYFPDGTPGAERRNDPHNIGLKYPPSYGMRRIREGIEYDEYGIVTCIDKTPDLIFTPEGDLKTDGRDELDAAFAGGELTREQYEDAIAEGERAQREFRADLPATAAMCASVREQAEKRIAAGEPILKCREVREAERTRSGG